MRRVSVIGIGETMMGKHQSRTIQDLIREAGEKAISDAGIDKKEIKAAYVGNFDGGYFCLQNHFGPMVSETLGLGIIPTVRTEGACASGSLAFRMGCLGILSGLYDVVLVGGVEKMTHQPTGRVTTGVASAMDFEREAILGMTFPAQFAMIANRYFHEYRNVKREMAMCAVSNHYNASLNPDAQMQKLVDLDTALSASLISAPLTIYDCSLVTDGAAFAVLAASDIAEKLCKGRIVDVIGAGHAGDALTLCGKKSITSFAAARAAAREAYSMANLKPSDIDFAEVHDCFTITQIINTEDLGFFAPGKGGDAVAEGVTSLNGQKPINTSGGLKAKGHPIGATGISQIYEVVTQLRYEAGFRQIKKADIGLAHNLGGTAATCLIHIFRGR